MFPRPVVQFLLRIIAPSITPVCLVSSERLTNPNTTIYILGKMDDGTFICLSPCVPVCICFLSLFVHLLNLHNHIKFIFMSKDSLCCCQPRKMTAETPSYFIKNMKPDTGKRRTRLRLHITFQLNRLSVNQNCVISL